MRNQRRPTAGRGRLAWLAGAISLNAFAACADPADPTRPELPPATSAAVTSASGTYNNFYNVQVGPEGLAINVYFQYLGKGSPILSLGKTSDMFIGAVVRHGQDDLRPVTTRTA